MRKIIFILITICAAGFTIHNKIDQKSLATVNQQQGIYIFTDSRPVAEYEVLGVVELKRSKYGEQYEPVRDAIITKLKKEFPGATGAILHLVNGSRDKADAIKLK